MTKLEHKYKTPKRLQKRINAYYIWAKKNKKPITCARLACFFNITPATLSTYAKSNDLFFEPIKKAYVYIEAEKSERLNSGEGNIIGTIFDLKHNHGWKDTPLFDQSINIRRTTFVLQDPRRREDDNAIREARKRSFIEGE